MINGRAADVVVSKQTASLSAAFPGQDAELAITIVGTRATTAARNASLSAALQILHSVRSASFAPSGAALPTGSPLPLTVTSVVPALAPYNQCSATKGSLSK